MPITSFGNEINVPSKSRSTHYSAKDIERLVTFIFQYRPLGMQKLFHIQTLDLFILVTLSEMLQANEIIPRNPQPLELHDAFDTLPTPITSSEKRKHSKVKEESEGESEDEDRKREKALLVCLRFNIVNSQLIIWSG